MKPWGKCVPLAAANTKYNLLALMQTLDSGAPKVVAHLRIQNPASQTGVNLFVGNDDLADAGTLNFGSEVVTGDFVELGPFDLNVIDPALIWIESDGASKVAAIWAVQK